MMRPVALTAESLDIGLFLDYYRVAVLDFFASTATIDCPLYTDAVSALALYYSSLSTAGHVIPPDQLLPVALARGPSGLLLDFTYQSRAVPETVISTVVSFLRCFVCAMKMRWFSCVPLAPVKSVFCH